MIKVKLNEIKSNRMTGNEALLLMTKAAQTCYKDTIPEPTEPMNIEGNIFKVSHHTVMQHLDFSFEIDGISVGDITFGLHLANPFYDSSQRSGRFCSAMFSNPDIEGIMAYICHYYELTGHQQEMVRRYLKIALQMYSESLPRATAKARELIGIERPNASAKYIDQNAPKFAQEQLRNFVPVIFPTGIFYTINLSALVALYRSAWNPILKDLTQQMADLVVAAIPGIRYMFERRAEESFNIQIGTSNGVLRDVVHAMLLRVPNITNAEIPNAKDMHPVDLLPFKPKFMENNTINIESEVQISVATMGQDQRHRTLRRGIPMLTGDFYLAPILAELNLDSKALDVMSLWKELPEDLPESLRVTLSPYGAMVRYRKYASLNAFLHEQHKRGCHCAQQEIYEVSRKLRKDLMATTEIPHRMGELLDAVSPACFFGHGCGEGARYCGRDLDSLLTNPFPKRTI